MCRQILAAGLATAILFTGCLLRKDQPVAQEKSIGRTLDEVFGQGTRGAKKLADEAKTVGRLVDKAQRRSLREDEMRDLINAIVSGGSKGINSFKTRGISKILDDFKKSSADVQKKLNSKIDELPEPAKNEFRLKDTAEKVEFMKKNTNIANDRIFKRLVKSQDKLLEKFNKAVATNHRLADAVGVEIANTPGNYGLKTLRISAEQLSSELKVSSNDFFAFHLHFATSPKGDVAEGYKLYQELAGINVYDKASELDKLLRSSAAGKYGREDGKTVLLSNNPKQDTIFFYKTDITHSDELRSMD